MTVINEEENVNLESLFIVLIVRGERRIYYKSEKKVCEKFGWERKSD